MIIKRLICYITKVLMMNLILIKEWKKNTRVAEEQKKNEKQQDAVQVISDEEENNKENEDINLKEVFSTKRKQNWKEINMQIRKTTKVEKNIVSDENVLKIQRIKQIIEEEKKIGNIRKVHENNMALMKENFSKELHALEVRAATAKAELAELQLQKEKMRLDI